jgi:hypothetical protein
MQTHPSSAPHGSRANAFFAIALLALAAACGGGGSSSSSTPPPPPPPPVVTPPYVRNAALAGSQEVPANASTAIGAASFSLDATTKVLTGTVTTAGIVATDSHIHEGAAGVAGPVIIPLTGGPGGVFTVPANTVLTDAQITSLKANTYYVNVHSAAFPAGEIRGQIILSTSFATLDGTQETPANASAATGYGALSVDPVSGAASGSVVTAGITGTDAHIHDGAAGVAGPVIVPLTDAGGGVWTVPAGATLTAAQITSWQNGNLYYNVHTTANPAGEIRGQLNLATSLTVTTTLTGANEVPANASTATGSAGIGLNPVTLEVTGGIATTGLVSTGAHIHQAAAGVAGPVIVPLTNGGSDTWLAPASARLTPAQFASWMAGNLYVNVHSAAFPAGEIRGQLVTTSSTVGGGGTGGTGGTGY